MAADGSNQAINLANAIEAAAIAVAATATISHFSYPRVDHLRDVASVAPEFQPRRPFGMMATRSTPPLQAAASEDITAGVSADVALHR